MDAVLMVVIAGTFLAAGYLLYGRYLARHVFDLDDANATPAHTQQDGKDFVPTKRSVLFGHHFTSIAGTGPIVGPAIAVMWGWLPALLWVLIGSVFIGAVHDFGSLVVSMRNRGRTVGDIAGDLLGPRARLLFLVILVGALWIVLAIFGLVIASVLRQYPAAITPVLMQVPLALMIGVFIHKRGLGGGKGLTLASVVALAVMYLSVVFGDAGVLGEFNQWIAAAPMWAWVAGLLAYCYVASVLPVWVLLQPRDYINALQLVSCLVLIVAGLFAAAIFGGPEIPRLAEATGGSGRPELSMVAPMIDWQPTGAPPLLPVLFITVACGACSGFHCLVSSGTSSKQLRREKHAKPVGYGAMVTEALLAVLVIAACAAGLGLGSSARFEPYALTTPSLEMLRELRSGERSWTSVVPESDLRFWAVHTINGDAQAAGNLTVAIPTTNIVTENVFTARYGPAQPVEALDEEWEALSWGSLVRYNYTQQFFDEAYHIADRDELDGYSFIRDDGSVALFDPQQDWEPFRPETTVFSEKRVPTAVLFGPIAHEGMYTSWQSAGSLGKKVGAFVEGAANFVASLGIPINIAVALMAVMVASFAATTLDTSCRLQRYVVQELAGTFVPRRGRGGCLRCGYPVVATLEETERRSDGETEAGGTSSLGDSVSSSLSPSYTCPECGSGATEEALLSADRPRLPNLASVFNPFRWLASTHGATLFAVVTAFGLAMWPANTGWPTGWGGSPLGVLEGLRTIIETGGTGALALWPLFGATNQLLAGFAFVVIAAWLVAKKKPVWMIVPPGIIMLAVPAAAMIWQAFIGNESNPSWLSSKNWLLVSVASATLALEAWLLVEVAIRWRRGLPEPLREMRGDG